MRLVIVGAGPGGVAAALVAAGKAQVTIVEAGRVGGNGWTGDLLASKVYLEAALKMGEKDLVVLASHRREAEEEASQQLAAKLADSRVDLVMGKGSLRSPKEVQVGPQILEANCLILATGSVPRRDGRFQYDGERIFTTKEAFRDGLEPHRPEGR